jgi:hypothetical protein
MSLIADISGSDALHTLLIVFLVVLCGLIIWWLGKTFFPKFGAPPILLTVWDFLFILLGALILINFLMGLAGHPFVKW